jgi:tetratricopeptide (TPR) repeat protein
LQHLLLSLANTPERALSLLAYCVDRSDEVKLHVDACGTVSFSELDLPGGWSAPDPVHRFRAIRIWLEGRAAKTLEAAGKLEEALDCSQQCLSHRLEYRGAADWHTNRERFDLARVMYKLGRFKETSSQLNQLEGSIGSIPDPDDDDRSLLADAAALRELLNPPS